MEEEKRTQLDVFSRTDGKIDYAEDAVDYVETEYTRRQSERRPWELQWKLNIAFIDGRQYLQINPAAADLEEVPKLFWWQEREIFNHIAPIVETRMSRLGRMHPVLKVKPPSPGGTDSDRGAAMVSTAIVGASYENMRMKSRLSEAVAWLESTGTVIFKYPWNPDAGQVVGYTGDQGDEEAQGEVIREGDIDAVVCPPQEILPDSCWHDGAQATQSIIHAKAYHVETIRDIWDVEIPAEDPEVERLQRVTAGTGGLGYGMGEYRLATVKMKSHAVVKELWELPSGKYPEGRLIITAGQKLLYAGPLPYEIGEDGKPALPFIRIQSIRRPGCFWGRSVPERLIPVQRRYNALRNRKAEYLNRCAIGIITYEEGSVDPDLLEDEGAAPGAQIPYRKGFNPPKFMDNPQLPAAFETEERTLLDEFTIISGVSELARQSKAPPGVKSGIAISLAIEQDDTRLSHTADNIKEGLEESGKMWLRHYKQWVQAPRILEKVGKNNLLAVTHWVGSDITADDVIVEGVSGLVESLAQKRQMIFDLMNTELFKDPKTGQISPEGRGRIFELLEFGDWENYDDTEQLHIDRAERENQAMVRGESKMPAEYDDHMLHIARHNRCRLTVEYEEDVAQNPAVADIFGQHILFHLMMLQASMPPAPAPAMEQTGPVMPVEEGGEVPLPPIVEQPVPAEMAPPDAPTPEI